MALIPDQVREYGLPSTPLKETEKRADKGREAFGVEQTEIDALATLRPDLLRRVARAAIARFYDYDLDQRVRQAYDEWRERAQAIVDAGMDEDRRSRIVTEAAANLAQLRTEIDALNDAMRLDVDDFDLPPIEIPEADPSLGVAPDDSLIDSSWSFIEQTTRLIDSKKYVLRRVSQETAIVDRRIARHQALEQQRPEPLSATEVTAQRLREAMRSREPQVPTPHQAKAAERRAHTKDLIDRARESLRVHLLGPWSRFGEVDR